MRKLAHISRVNFSRSSDELPPAAGASWEPLGDGLPQRDAFLTVLRDGFGGDGLTPAGLYFGTRTGQLYASADEGERWRLVAEWLPPVVCVKAAVVP